MEKYYENRLFSLLEEGKYSEFSSLAGGLPPENIAAFLDELDRDRLIFAFRLLNKDTASAVFEKLGTDAKSELVDGMRDGPYLKVSPFKTVAARLPWLLILMLSSAVTGAIITAFEAELSSLIVLTAFIPMLMGTGGNAGAQVSVTVTRALSLGELAPRDAFRVLKKELFVSLLCGICLGTVSFLKLCLFDAIILANSSVTITVALAVSLSLGCTVVCAKLTGAALPILASRLGIDPALAAGPAVTTVVDIASLLIYFGFARLLLKI